MAVSMIIRSVGVEGAGVASLVSRIQIVLGEPRGWQCRAGCAVGRDTPLCSSLAKALLGFA